MKQTVRVICSLVLACCVTGGAWAGMDTGNQLVCVTDSVVVNWTEGILKATGRGVPPEAYYGDEQGRKIALAAAIESARNELIEAIKKIPIDEGSTVGDLIKNNPSVFVALKDIVDAAEVIHQEFTTDGSVEVTVQMSMNGGFSQLVLPKQIESIKPISASSGGSSEDGADSLSASDEVVSGPYTGMIVDVRGICVTPCLAPRVFDENGQEVFGPAYASREFAVQRGMTGYISDIKAAARHPRVADRPLILKGLRTCGVGGNDIVVSNTDAAKLRSAFENLAFLRQCRVMIVADAPDASGKG